MNKVIIFISIAVTAVALCGAAYIVNKEDTLRMEIAAQNGLIQCEKGSFVLWKKSCNE